MAIKSIALKLTQLFVPRLPSLLAHLSARELHFYGRGKGGKTSPKRSNAAQLKRLSKKANNISKHK